MFATHYHELTALEEQPGICNYSVAVKEDGDKITFLRKIIPGGADRSYGIHVASLAGIPEQILQNAKSILRTLELEKAQHRPQTEQITLFAQEEPIQTVEVVNRIPEVVEELAAVNVNNLTPMDAMNLLFQLQKKAQEVVAHGLD
jgi:DNA mismatch repair protein MutS